MMNRIAVVCFLVLGACATVLPAHAQFQLQQQASITLSPEFPLPYEEVTATLNTSTLNTTGGVISWFLNGSELTERANERSVTFQVGTLGSEMQLQAIIALPTGERLDISKTITPSRVDVIIEGKTLVPNHYNGRALPSSGSEVRAIAIPAGDFDTTNLVFTWELDGKMLLGGPVLGRDTVTFTAPEGGDAILSVEITTREGEPLARKKLLVPLADVAVLFYETNPLRGNARIAMQNTHSLIGDEITVRAEPYHIAANIFETDHLIEWKVNSKSVDNPSDNPQEITLRGGSGVGSFRVDFHIRNLTKLLQGAQESFRLTF